VGRAPRRPVVRAPRRRERAGARRAPSPGERRPRARARGGDAGRRPEGDPRQDGRSHRVTLLQWLAYVVPVAGFWGVWYLVGRWAGTLLTRRGLAAGAAVAVP